MEVLTANAAFAAGWCGGIYTLGGAKPPTTPALRLPGGLRTTRTIGTFDGQPHFATPHIGSLSAPPSYTLASSDPATRILWPVGGPKTQHVQPGWYSSQTFAAQARLLAERAPDFLRQSIAQVGCDEEGANQYEVRLPYRAGPGVDDFGEAIVRVDDRLLTVFDNATLAAAPTLDAQGRPIMWPIVLEKALVKLFDSLRDVRSEAYGLSLEGSAQLGGNVTQDVYLHRPELLSALSGREAAAFAMNVFAADPASWTEPSDTIDETVRAKINEKSTNVNWLLDLLREPDAFGMMSFHNFAALHLLEEFVPAKLAIEYDLGAARGTCTQGTTPGSIVVSENGQAHPLNADMVYAIVEMQDGFITLEPSAQVDTRHPFVNPWAQPWPRQTNATQTFLRRFIYQFLGHPLKPGKRITLSVEACKLFGSRFFIGAFPTNSDATPGSGQREAKTA